MMTGFEINDDFLSVQPLRGEYKDKSGRRVHGLYIVTRGKSTVWGPGPLNAAYAYLDRIRYEARISTRNCLRCTKPFMSEGAHNRMCVGCRHVTTTAEDTAI